MLLADKTVTITHLAYDGKTDADVKTETVLHGCSWQAQHGSRIGTGTQTAALLVRCMVRSWSSPRATPSPAGMKPPPCWPCTTTAGAGCPTSTWKGADQWKLYSGADSRLRRCTRC